MLHPYSLATFVVAIVRGSQATSRLQAVVDFCVLDSHKSASSAKERKCEVRLWVKGIKASVFDLLSGDRVVLSSMLLTAPSGSLTPCAL